MQVTNPPSITSQDLLALAQAAHGKINRLYLHWTAGRYHQFFDDYHLNVDEDGQVYRTCHSLDERKAHTYKRNTGSVGIALCCALDANWTATMPKFGTMPPTLKQLKSLAWIVAILCTALGIAITSDTVMTHGEAAYRDGYGPGSGDPETRWDLFWVLDEQGAFRQGGVYVRELARQYSTRLVPSQRKGAEQNAYPASAAAPLQVPLFME